MNDIFPFQPFIYPPSLVEARYVMRHVNKRALSDDVWALLPQHVVGTTGLSQYVLDGRD